MKLFFVSLCSVCVALSSSAMEVVKLSGARAQKLESLNPEYLLEKAKGDANDTKALSKEYYFVWTSFTSKGRARRCRNRRRTSLCRRYSLMNRLLIFLNCDF